MSVAESLRRRARFLAAGFVSFVVLLALMRWSGGEPPVQSSADIGLVIGFIFVAASFVMNDTYGQRGGRAR